MIINRNEDRIFQDTLEELFQNSKIIESKQYIQHGNTTILKHSIAVAYYSYLLALLLKIPVSKRELIRGALLHDYFLYDWHKKDVMHRLHGFRHPYKAFQNASRDLELSHIEKDIILKHMFPLTVVPPKYVESMIVCVIDKVCSVYETFYLNQLIKLYGYNLRKSS